MPRTVRVFALLLAGVVGACAAPESLDGEAPGPDQDEPVVTDPSVRTIQLYQSGEEVSLPVLSLRDRNQLTLEFDVLGTTASRSLDIEFRRVNTSGGPDLVSTEYLTGFDRDEIFDAEASGTTSVPFVHYRYSFPTSGVGKE